MNVVSSNDMVSVSLYQSVYRFACQHYMQNFKRPLLKKFFFKLPDLIPPRVLKRALVSIILISMPLSINASIKILNFSLKLVYAQNFPKKMKF